MIEHAPHDDLCPAHDLALGHARVQHELSCDDVRVFSRKAKLSPGDHDGTAADLDPLKSLGAPESARVER